MMGFSPTGLSFQPYFSLTSLFNKLFSHATPKGCAISTSLCIVEWVGNAPTLILRLSLTGCSIYQSFHSYPFASIPNPCRIHLLTTDAHSPNS